MSWTADAIFGAVAPVRWPADMPVRLHLVVDTEESFDWSGPFRREGHDLRALRALPLLIRRLERWRVVPTCVVTWPVVASADGRPILGELLASGTIAVGAHLHPWVTPPFEELLGSATSYAGNLAPGLEAAKLAALGERIGEVFGRPPRAYKAARYGLGPASAGTPDRLGYRIDLSGYPCRDFTADGGPD